MLLCMEVYFVVSKVVFLIFCDIMLLVEGFLIDEVFFEVGGLWCIVGMFE